MCKGNGKRREELNDGGRNHEGKNVTMEAGITRGKNVTMEAGITRGKERNDGGRNHERGRT